MNNYHSNHSGSSCAHHLLKHCLSDNQRTEALAHFGTDDVKEAAKEIARMGQRDLQSKFKMVYGTATHSNNNDWLRRKLYEAVGAAPMKTTTKTKQRKPSTPKGRSRMEDLTFQPTNFNAGSGFNARRRRNAKGRSFASAGSQSKGRGSLPASPIVGRSVLDFHGLMVHDASTTSEDSDDWEGEEQAKERKSGNFSTELSQPLTSSEEGSSRSSFLLEGNLSNFNGSSHKVSSIGTSDFDEAQPATMGQRVPSLGYCGLPPLNLDAPSSANPAANRIDAWADAALKAQSSRRQSSLPMGIFMGEEDESMLISMDLSAFDASAGCSLL